MLTAYLLAQSKLIDAALEGKGAQLHGGRWNSKGVPVVYLARSLSLAVAEMQAHLEAHKMLLTYSYRSIKFNNNQSISLDKRLLSKHWRQHPASAKIRSIGDSWVHSGDSLLLRVPSAVIPGEYNYLLNPRHADFKHLLIGDAKQFPDQPLWVGSA